MNGLAEVDANFVFAWVADLVEDVLNAVYGTN
jgi:hypothetical protein